MALVSPNMTLDVWDLGTDPYDHTELAGNFNKIDAHDHTTGKGVQIPTGGIEDDAITTDKIADGAVTTDKLSGSVDSGNLDQNFIHPIGQFMWWWRPNGSTAIPTGWVVCDGSTLGAAAHEFRAAAQSFCRTSSTRRLLGLLLVTSTRLVAQTRRTLATLTASTRIVTLSTPTPMLSMPTAILSIATTTVPAS